ncbi:MAG: T9SS type A sorting domain-containing protein, partial [Flavobacteriaceae bacterium]
SLSTNKDVQVSLFDIRGRQVYGKVFNNTSDSFNERVDFNAMSSGVYMLEVQSGSKRAIKKLVIQ